MTNPAFVPGAIVISADGVPLGVVESVEAGFLRVRRDVSPNIVWVSTRLVSGASGHELHLFLDRDDLHDGVIALPPARQREYSTLESLSFLARRSREAREFASPRADAEPASPGGSPN